MKIKLYKRLQTGKIGWWSGEVLVGPMGQGAVIKTVSAAGMDAKPVEHLQEIQGKNIGRSNETTPWEQACSELQSKANKKRDGGYKDSIDEVGEVATNTLGFVKPQKAQPYKDLSDRQLDKIDWSNAYVQRKLDGHRASLTDDLMYSSGGKIIELAHLAGIDTNGLQLDGELYVHGMRLQDIGKLIKKYRPGETEKVEFHVFDHVATKGFGDRVKDLVALHKENTHPSLVFVDTYKVTSMKEVLDWHAKFLAEGYEGTMLRHGVEGYKGGSRCLDIIKIKDMEDSEFVITDVLEGKRKLYRGIMTPQARFVCKDTNTGKTFKVYAPGTVIEKAAPLDNPKAYTGKLLTVQYFGFTKDGVPNLPVAKCLREDL